ncbi:MAG: RluA family pseudouridine synthase [Sulfurospirillaceae bacterium]|nr:RluA family pseudouridine synthase [Sulfurospirillaceae bacterium]MDD2825360.1 RluA family pseudouridine synthase [Sulfurospirillaceae bacterium]
MAYILKKFFLAQPKFAFRFLIDEFDISMGEAQKIIDKKRVFVNDVLLEQKSCMIKGDISVVVFKGQSKGLKPIFETDDFAVFDKPSGVMIHPRSRSDGYTLNDEIKALYGNEANPIHRIDKSTSGLVLVGKNKRTEIELKKLFANREVHKRYIALVEGKIDSAFLINEKIKRDCVYSKIRMKVHVDAGGKDSQTKIIPLEYFEDKNATLVEAIPLTGRQHQIRVHLFHVKHKIFGDAIYGLSEEDANSFLEGTLSDIERISKTGAERLLLHAQSLVFEYHGEQYTIESNFNARNSFYTLCQ